MEKLVNIQVWFLKASVSFITQQSLNLTLLHCVLYIFFKVHEVKENPPRIPSCTKMFLLFLYIHTYTSLMGFTNVKNGN